MAGRKKKRGGGDGSPGSPRIRNRKAWKEFHITEKLECGIALTGTEVKSVRAGSAKIGEAYVRIENNELFLVGANIAHYKHADPSVQHDPTRKRKLLAHRRQIAALTAHVQQKGRTLVPLTLYFHRGRAKLEVGLAEGRRKYDKRETIRSKQQQKDIEKEVRRGKG